MLRVERKAIRPEKKAVKLKLLSFPSNLNHLFLKRSRHNSLCCSSASHRHFYNGLWCSNSRCNCRSAQEVCSHHLLTDFSLLPVALETALIYRAAILNTPPAESQPCSTDRHRLLLSAIYWKQSDPCRCAGRWFKGCESDVFLTDVYYSTCSFNKFCSIWNVSSALF